MTEEVVNWSYSTRDVRISIPIGISYGCDVDLAHQLMVEAASASPRVLKTPRPAVWITALGENAINHEIRVWIADPEAGLGSVRSEILHRLLQLFVENDISVPFPQRDIRIREWPGSGDRPSGAGKPDRPTGRSKP
jgi:small-conductance mechanosensitive channel